MTACVKCGSGSFGIKLFSPSGGNYKLNFVECNGCRTPVGVIGYYDEGAMLKLQEGQISALSKKVDQMSFQISHIEQMLQNLRR